MKSDHVRALLTNFEKASTSTIFKEDIERFVYL